MSKEIKLKSVEGSERWGLEKKFAESWKIRISVVVREDKAEEYGKS